MKKIFSTIFWLLTFFLLSIVIILSTLGLETKRFNNLISKKINENNSNVILELETVKFKLDVKNLSLFIETKNPQINYRGALLPAKDLKVYMKFLSLIKSEPQIEKINVSFDEISIDKLKKLSIIFKPSNFTSFINNKIQSGFFNTDVEIYLNNDNSIDNFIARGDVKDLKIELINGIEIEESNFSYFADNSDILVRNFFGRTDFGEIEDGDIRFKLNPNIFIKSNFKTKIKINKDIKINQEFNKYLNFVNLKYLDTELNNNFTLEFDKTYKLSNYEYKSNGKINEAKIVLNKPINNEILDKSIKEIILINSKIINDFNLGKKFTNITGNYQLYNDKKLKFDLERLSENKKLNIKFNTEFDEAINLNLVNYIKTEGDVSNISGSIIKKDNLYEIKELKYSEKKNLIDVKNLIFDKGKFSSLKKNKS